jgi:hypothetical protein
MLPLVCCLNFKTQRFFDTGSDEEQEVVTLVEVKKSLTRRSIEQLGFIKDINSLVVLSGNLRFF